MNDAKQVKPLRLVPSLLIFVVTATMIYLSHYVFAPAFQRATGQPYLTGYIIAWGSNMLIIFLAAMGAYKLEGGSFKWAEFSERFRLGRMEKNDWFWTLVVIAVAVLFYFGLSFTSGWLAKIPLFAPHPAFPEDMVTGQPSAGELFGMTLAGKWWVLGAYFVFWVLNILGEEFWYRGWMLPRQEAAFGRFAWLVNGLMFTFQHWLQPWNFLIILPSALFAVYAVQKRRNTWITIIQHGLMNLSLVIFVLRSVIG